MPGTGSGGLCYTTGRCSTPTSTKKVPGADLERDLERDLKRGSRALAAQRLAAVDPLSANSRGTSQLFTSSCGLDKIQLLKEMS